MDLKDISSAYTSVKAIKEIGSLLLNAKIDSESKKRVSEVLDKLGGVQDSLFYIREELLKVQDENYDLKMKLKEYEKIIEDKGNVKYEKPYYWKYEGEDKDGPFCQKCFDANNQLIRLQGRKNDLWSCRECKNTYTGSNYVEPQIKRRKSNSRMVL